MHMLWLILSLGCVQIQPTVMCVLCFCCIQYSIHMYFHVFRNACACSLQFVLYRYVYRHVHMQLPDGAHAIVGGRLGGVSNFWPVGVGTCSFRGFTTIERTRSGLEARSYRGSCVTLLCSGIQACAVCHICGTPSLGHSEIKVTVINMTHVAVLFVYMATPEMRTPR